MSAVDNIVKGMLDAAEACDGQPFWEASVDVPAEIADAIVFRMKAASIMVKREPSVLGAVVTVGKWNN